MSQKQKVITRLEIYFFEDSAGEQSDIYTSDLGIIDYHISEDVLFVYVNGEEVSTYNRGIWKRIYTTY